MALAGSAVAQQPATLRIEGRLEGTAAGTLGAGAEWVVELRDDTADRVKARCVVLLFALAHNLMRALKLAPALPGTGPQRVCMQRRGRVKGVKNPRLRPQSGPVSANAAYWMNSRRSRSIQPRRST